MLSDLRFAKNSFLVFALYFVVSIQSVSLMRFGGASLKTYHVFVVLVFLYVLFTFKPAFPKRSGPVFIYLTTLVVLSAINYRFAGFNSLVLNYVFAIGIVLTAGMAVGSLQYRNVISGLRLASWAVAALLLLDIALSYGFLFSHLMTQDENRIVLLFDIYGGGINLEATWTALACSFFLRNKFQFIGYVIASFTIDYAMLSRAGFVITILIAGYWLWHNRSCISGWWALPLLAIVAVYAVYLVSGGMVGANLYDRFAALTGPRWGSGRQALWHTATAGLMERPWFGWGAGNAIHIARAMGFTGPEDNVHNYVLQQLLDFGRFGLVLWIAFCSFVLLNTRERPEFRIYFVSFIVASMVEFRGAEPMLYLVIALLICSDGDQDATVEDCREDLACR